MKINRVKISRQFFFKAAANLIHLARDEDLGIIKQNARQQQNKRELNDSEIKSVKICCVSLRAIKVINEFSPESLNVTIYVLGMMFKRTAVEASKRVISDHTR